MSAKNKRVTDTFKAKKKSRPIAKSGKGQSEPQPSSSKAAEEEDFKILKEFDLNWEYGPSMGITRLERWNRAAKHGLNPLPLVRQLVEEHKDDERYTQCLWNDYKNIM